MTGRLSPVVRAARLVQRLPLSWLRPLEAPLVRMKADQDSQPQLVFLLALPRSGSTLTYQALVHSLQPLYLSNLWNLLYALPLIGGALSSRQCASHSSDFRSSHGFVEGICGPAEGLRFWSYWSGCGLEDSTTSVVQRGVLERRIAYLRRVVSALSDESHPFVTAYLGHVLVAEQLRAWFPEAVFLRLHRDPLANAASILRTRMTGSGEWFSVFPRECEGVVGQGVHAEVAAQVYWLNRRLEVVRDGDRTIHFHYEELCADPNATVARITERCNYMGLALERGQALPESFEYRSAKPEEDADMVRLHQEFQRLEREHGPLAEGTMTS